MLKELKEYFKNTSPDKIQEDWNKTKESDNIGPTMDEFLIKTLNLNKMRTFEHPNTNNGWKCPICGTDEDKPIVLIGISGTEEGSIIQAEQVHLDCIELSWNKEVGVIYQKV